MKRQIIIIAVFFVISSAKNAFSEYDPSDDLINAFGSKCSSYGTLTQTALSQANTLKATLKSLRDDPACKSSIPCTSTNAEGVCISDQISENLNLLEKSKNNQVDKLTNLTEDLRSAIEIETNKGEKSDANYISMLQTELNQTSLDLLKAKQDNNFQKNKKDISALISFYKNSSELMTNLSANQLCMKKNGNVITKIGAQILSVSSEWVSGLAGSALLAVGGIVDQLVGLVRDSLINRDIKGLLDSKLEYALGCTLEGLSTTYCQARDLQLVIKQNAKFQNENSCEVSRGINLLSIDVNAYLESLDALIAGSPATSAASAGEKKWAMELYSGLEKMKLDLDQKITSGSKKIKLAKTSEDKDLEQKLLVNDLATRMKPEISKGQSVDGAYVEVPGFLSKVVLDDPDCGIQAYYYSGGTASTCTKNMSENCAQCISRNYKKIPSIEEIRARTSEITKKASEFVSDNVQMYKENNPNLALAKMFNAGTDGRKGVDFLNNASTYLDVLLQDKNGISKKITMRNMITSTKKRIDDALQIINEKITEGMSESDAGNVGSMLNDVLTKGNDIYLIPRAISSIVKEDLITKMNSGVLDKNLVVVLKLSTSDSLSEMLTNYRGKEYLRNQARSAKDLTKKNISALVGVFGKNIENNIIKLNDKRLKEKTEDSKEDFELACMRSLTIPEGPSKKIKDLCKWHIYKPLNSNSKIKNTLIYEEFADLKYEDRACVLYDFYRKSKLSELGSMVMK